METNISILTTWNSEMYFTSLERSKIQLFGALKTKGMVPTTAAMPNQMKLSLFFNQKGVAPLKVKIFLFSFQMSRTTVQIFQMRYIKFLYLKELTKYKSSNFKK